MNLSLIVALDGKGLIGRENHLPWRLPADLKHFKQITMGKPVIMGRRTCQSLTGPLPGRRNLVLTRNPHYQREGFEVVHGVEEAWSELQAVDEAMVIGGADVYRLFWPHLKRAYVTLVDGFFEGDTWFPEWPLGQDWLLKSSLARPPDDHNIHAVTFMMFEKVEKI